MMYINKSTVYEWLKEAVKQRNEFDNNTIHVSEVTQCLRKSYYQRISAKKFTGVEAVILIGAQLHESLQNVIRRYGFRTEFQVAVKENGVKLVGHIDAYHPEAGVVLEFKTVDKIPEKCYTSHYLQANAYHFMGLAEATYIIYISRSRGDVEVRRIKPSMRKYEELIKRAKILSEALNNNRPPYPEPSHTCNYCPFKYRCKPWKTKAWRGIKQ